MSRLLKLGGVLVALVLLVVACGAPAATTAPTTKPTTAPTATTAPTTAPTATQAATASPTAAASPSPSNAASSGPASPSPSPSPTLPPAAQTGVLTIWADTVRAPILKSLAADFTAATGAQVAVYELGFGDIRDRLTQAGPAGEGPDIIIGAHDWLGQLVQAGVVDELTPTDTANVIQKFDPVALSAFSYGGKLYGLPYVSEAVALYYNKDLVPGGTPPTTWDQMKKEAADFQGTDTTKQGFCLQKGDPYHTEPILTGFGGYIFGRNADGSYNPQDVGLDSPGGLAYASELDSMVKAGLLRDNVDFGACETLFTTGKALFWITGPWELKKFTDTAGLNFGVAPIPTMKSGVTPRPFVGVQGFMVNKFAKNELLAKTFLTEYVATDATMLALWKADPRLPVWKQLQSQTDLLGPNIAAFTTSAGSGDPMPAIPEMSKVWDSWTKAINLVFTQQQDAQSAFKDAATAIRGLIGQ